MALTKAKKYEIVAEVTNLLSQSKMTVIAKYEGTPVKAMQALRRQARDNGTTVKVVKNRLVRQALAQTENLKSVDTGGLEGMLLYAFNGEDEVASSQAIAAFAKVNPNVVFVGAISKDGKLLSAAEVQSLATLPGKEQLISQVMTMLASPLTETINALAGNLHGILDTIGSQATS